MSDVQYAVRDRTVLNGRRFLVVDDHGYMIDVINEILKHFGADDTVRADSVGAALGRIDPRRAYDALGAISI